MSDWKGIIFCFVVTLCIVTPIFYFAIGQQMLDEGSIEDIARNRIIVKEGYRLDSINAFEYSDNWWYVSIDTINVSNGSTGWDLIKYNSNEDKFVYDSLQNIVVG